jgi:spermidine dehydrogenase
MSDDARELPASAPPGVSRRDFLGGTALGLGAAALGPLGLAGCEPAAATGARAAAQDLPGYYPPALTGLRGSHPGSFEAAHALRDGATFGAALDTGEVYDLVVVGGGISGLAAAHFYRERVPDARVLVLDNHDDFGGHAKRNEFTADGRLVLMNGGTYSYESPTPYSRVAEDLIERLGIHPQELATRIQKPDFYAGLGLAPGIFLDRDTFGADHLLRRPPGASWTEVLAAAPLPERVRHGIIELEEGRRDYLPGVAPAEKKTRLLHTSYADFLGRLVGVEPGVVAFYQQRTHSLWGVGIDAVSALEAAIVGLPGFQGLGLPPGSIPGMGATAAGYADTGGSVDVHLPDGGATVARALVAALVPGALAARDIDALVTAPVDYARLDRGGAPVRIRLGATAVRVANVGGGGVEVDYLRAGHALRVRGRHAVLACWNAVIPHLCPELPAAQQAALHELVKTPIVYANVLLRSREPWHALGVASVHCPGGYFCDIDLNEYQRIGRYATATEPAAPLGVRLTRTPCAPGLTERDQNRAGRADLLATSFERFEQEIRAQLGRVFGPGGFDAGRDILAITVNRWPHGYAPEFNALFDPLVPEAEQPHVRGRARRGAIAIANSDSGLKAFMDSAIDEAHRAVGELLTA